ncbi:MAG: tRNA (adenine-N1)-methyltransferase [bacterium JZ-2024 1]
MKPGEWVLLVSPDEKKFLFQVEPDKVLHTHKGMIPHNDLLPLPYGACYKEFILLKPTFEEIILKGIRRQTQIVYPKDAGLLAVKLSLPSARLVLEIGAGSGAFTTFLSLVLPHNSKVISYEIREEFYHLALQNVSRFGNPDRVELRKGDPRDNLPEPEFDAIFVDVKTPTDFLSLCWEKLKGGHPVAFSLPTTNQIQDLLRSMEEMPFTSIEVTELLERKYKPVSARLRPYDRMVAHTVYLLTARKFSPS